MEDKKITEQESLELITKMIQQTKKESAIGSGNIFLVWGYLCTFMSLSVYLLAYASHQAGWGWLYILIPALGFIASGIMARWMKKKYRTPSTYATKSINSIWGVVSAVFAAYAFFCFFDWTNTQGWTGMFLLGLLLPGIGTYATGTILNEKALQVCGIIGCIFGMRFLYDLCCLDTPLTIKWPLLMALSMIVALVIPGHILNYKAKKANKTIAA